MIIRTERLELAPLDRATATSLLGDPRDDWAPGFPQEGDRTVAGWVVEHGPDPDGWGPWQVRSRGDGLLLGTIGFHGPPADGEVEVGYGIAESHRRRGLATEALAAILEWAAGRGAARATARVEPTNRASVAVLEHLGFDRVGQPDDFEVWMRELG